MKARQAKPRFQHDCDACQFLGHVYYPGPLITGESPLRHADLYFCKQADAAMGSTVIARFSSKGSDYASTPVRILEGHYLKSAAQGHLSTSGPALIAAYYFAKAKRLFK